MTVTSCGQHVSSFLPAVPRDPLGVLRVAVNLCVVLQRFVRDDDDIGRAVIKDLFAIATDTAVMGRDKDANSGEVSAKCRILKKHVPTGLLEIARKNNRAA